MMRHVLAVLLLVSTPAWPQVVAPPPYLAAPPGPTKPTHSHHKVAKPAAGNPVVAKPPTGRASTGKPPAGKPVEARVAKPPVASPPVPTPAPASPPPPDPAKGTSTGLMLPRWAAFRSDEVNLRSGPGTQYPIDWVYHRRDLPVRIEREYEVWRLVETQDGTKGWVHQATLTGRRGFVVADAERTLRANPDEAAAPVARLQAGVVGHIRSCEAAKDWCEVQAGDYRGFLRRAEIWGVQPDEAIN